MKTFWKKEARNSAYKVDSVSAWALISVNCTTTIARM